ncbi:hypothetical protein M8C21_009993 [Ambrosia artemisiifolia]|uniref:Uncharacterized protein n=1 Tax=Ambrosia artemisiifolia TaxID=4212 RepID=A0AAD5DCG6_AMBAR|nr:hypothetical protein M8C21_009993 [Ambrosia artemisiifolia]
MGMLGWNHQANDNGDSQMGKFVGNKCGDGYNLEGTMVKNKAIVRKSTEVATSKSKKGKEKAESSKGSKRPRKQLVDESSDEDDPTYEAMEEDNQEDEAENGEEEEVEGDAESESEWSDDGLPRWRKPKPLSKFPVELRAALFMKKINKSTQPLKDLFLCERLIDLKAFEPFGVIECFKRLGWMDFLKFKGGEFIYMDQILEWMSTLIKDEGKNPPATTRLIGKVGNKEVVLSFAVLRDLTKYDQGATVAGDYEYPKDEVIEAKKIQEEEWGGWIRNLFDVPPGTNLTKWKLKRKNLHAFPMLLLRFVTTAVMPRTSDLNNVRLFEVMILYALLT